jgi:lipopolysaccharide export system protein LptA
MRTNVERLRVWLVAGAAALVLVVAVFLVVAHRRSLIFIGNLPKGLAAGLARSAGEYTYSHTLASGTVFTLRAGKLEQRTDGKVTLRDVGIVLYGPKLNRSDRIYGKEFEWDEANGVVRAIGQVEMDLQAPSAAPGSGDNTPPQTKSEPKVVHVKTSGVVYLTKLGVAATAEDTEFSEGQMTGYSKGAEYTSDSGLLVLQSNVRINGLTSRGPMVLTASHAEWNRTTGIATLADARLVMTQETIDAQTSVVHLRQDGTPEKMDGAGKVVITLVAGGVLTAQTGDVVLNPAGKAQSANFSGGVLYLDDEAARHVRGQAQQAQATFDAAGNPQHAVLTGQVDMQEQMRGAANQAWSTRNLTGNVVQLAFAPAAQKGRTEIHDAQATGDGRLVVVNVVPAAGDTGKTTRTELVGDDLKAHMLPGNLVSDVVATGHTSLHQVAADGVDEVSSGDETDLKFRAAAAPKNKKAPARGASRTQFGREELATAVQVGHVVSVRKAMQMQTSASGEKEMAAVEERSLASRGVFDADSNKVTLSGGVTLSDRSSMIWGDRAVIDRASGDATLDGAVRVNYLQDTSGTAEAEPVHILADRAELKRGAKPATAKPAPAKGALVASSGADKAFFYGSAAKPARMWQGLSQVTAPILEFEQAERRLTASGPAPGMVVHTVLVGSNPPPEPAKAPAAKKNNSPQQGAMRVASHLLVYSDGPREAVFSGGVLLEEADGSMRAQKVVAYLAPAAAKSGAAAPAKPEAKPDPKAPAFVMGGNLDHVVATGKIEIVEPGRRATGEQVVYTAKDGLYVLTGTPDAPPRMDDEAKGTTTGAAIRFHSGDNSVVVTSGDIEQEKGKPKKMRTETRVKQ